MRNSTRNRLTRAGESAALSAMLTLATALMFTIKAVEFPFWTWIIEFAVISGIAFLVPRPPRSELTSSQKHLLLFSAIAAVVLAVVLLIIIVVN